MNLTIRSKILIIVLSVAIIFGLLLGFYAPYKTKAIRKYYSSERFRLYHKFISQQFGFGHSNHGL